VFFSIIAGLYFAFTKRSATVDDRAVNKNANRGLAFLSVIAFWTMIGIVASLYQNAYLDADANTYGTNPRYGDYTLRTSDNYANQVSSFAWEHSIFAACIASAAALELIFHGVGTGGIISLTIVFAANLIGWASYHLYVGSITNKDNLSSRTRAWAALALVAGAIALFTSINALRNVNNDDAPRTTDGNESIEPADRDQFVTKGQP